MDRALVLLVCAGVLACDGDGGSIVEPAPQVALRLSPPSVEAAPGTEFEVSLILENSLEVFGLSVDVVFDSTAVGVVPGGVTLGDLFGETPIALVMIGSDRVSVGASLPQTPAEDRVTGSGVVASIRFASRDTVRSEIGLRSVLAVTDSGEPTALAGLEPTVVN